MAGGPLVLVLVLEIQIKGPRALVTPATTI
jgi:hypothetical protein